MLTFTNKNVKGSENMAKKDRGWEYLNSGNSNEFDFDPDGDGSWGIQNGDGSDSYYGADGSWGYRNSDGSASYYGNDGSWGYRNSDGSASYYGNDGSWGYRNSDGSGSFYEDDVVAQSLELGRSFQSGRSSTHYEYIVLHITSNMRKVPAGRCPSLPCLDISFLDRILFPSCPGAVRHPPGESAVRGPRDRSPSPGLRLPRR